MFIRPIISLQDNSFPLFLDEEHNADLFDYQYHRQERMNALMYKLMRLGPSTFYTRAKLEFDTISDLSDSVEFSEIAKRLANHQKVHSTEYAFFVLVTKDVNLLDVEMMKRLQHMIATDAAVEKFSAQMQAQYNDYKALMNIHLDVLIRLHACRVSLLPAASKHLLDYVKKLVHRSDYLNLRKFDFSGMDLSGFSFVHANLNAAVFTQTNLNGARFELCILNGVWMGDTVSQEEDEDNCIAIRNSKLINASLNYRKLLLSDSEVSGCALAGANITCESTQFSYCDFNNARVLVSKPDTKLSFSHCDLSSASYHSNGYWAGVEMNEVLLFKDCYFNEDHFSNEKNVVANFIENEEFKIKAEFSIDRFRRYGASDAAANIANMELCVAKSVVCSLARCTLPPATARLILTKLIDYLNSRHFSYLKVTSGFFHSLFVADQHESAYQSKAIAVLMAAGNEIEDEVSYANTVMMV